MNSDAVDVFDLDGTLIHVNSFREITRETALALLKRFRLKPVFILAGAYIIRRMGIWSHVTYAKCAVNIFDSELTTEEKKGLAASVFDKNVNKPVLERLLLSKKSVICTASPYSYASLMPIGKDVALISAFDPRGIFPDAANVGEGKVKNLNVYFGKDKMRIVNFYTDSLIDQPLIDLAENAFLCEKGRIRKIK